MEPDITEATLAQYRSEIDHLDRRLLELMAARLDLCLQIGRLKQALGLPMMQNGRIAEVLTRVAERAAQHRVSPEFAAAVWRMIIDEACRLERDDRHGTPLMTTHSRSFHHCVVLGAGAVGRMLLAELPADVTELDAFDVSPTEGVRYGDALNMSRELRTVLRTADLVVLALPEAVILAALHDVLQQVPSTCLVVETGSVKTPVAAALAQTEMRREVLGINPMFAPSLGMAGQSVAVVDYTDGARAEVIRQCIARWGATIVTVSAQRHDEIASITQAALHSMLLAFGGMLADHKADWPQLRLLATPPFRAILLLVARVFAQNPATYWDIQASNPAAASSRRRLLESLERTHALVCDPDGATQFEEWFRCVAASFGPSLDALKEQSDAVLKGIPRYRS